MQFLSRRFIIFACSLHGSAPSDSRYNSLSSLHIFRIFIRCNAARDFFCIFSLIASSTLHNETAIAHADILIRLRQSVLFSHLSNHWATRLTTDAGAIAATQDLT